MPTDFVRSLQDLLRGLDQTGATHTHAGTATAKHILDAETAHRRKWFARFAADRVMPLLRHAAQAVEQTGGIADCRLNEGGDALTAELVIIPPNLPKGAPPPRLSISVAPGERALAVDYTGTFPGAGATGGFGSEIDFDTIYPSQVEEKIIDFVALATGA
jgi:hypothetical protein